MSHHDRFGHALSLAHEAHRAQLRKGTAIPYIAHPMAVSALTLEYGGNEDQAIAALLHDAVEDGGSSYAARIEQVFGPNVLTMVNDCTDGTAEGKAAVTTREEKRTDWKSRKLTYLQQLRNRPSTAPSLLVSACDKLHNARAILADFRQIGMPLFDRFTAGREGTLWYYNELAAIFMDKDVAPAANLRQTVDALLADVEAQAR